jgi:hypothetical protein
MGRKKKAKALLEAVGHLFADPPKRKQLLKEKHLRSFLEDLRKRQAELEREFEAAPEGEAVEVAADLAVLVEQIAKAEKLLKKLED